MRCPLNCDLPEFPRARMEYHYDNDCPKAERMCHNCEALVKRKIAQISEEKSL